MTDDQNEIQVGPAGECVLCGKNYDLEGLTMRGFNLLLTSDVQDRLVEALRSKGGVTFPLIVCSSWDQKESPGCTPTVDCPHCEVAACDHKDTKCWNCGGVIA